MAAVLVTVGVAAVTLLSANRVPQPRAADAPATVFSAQRAAQQLAGFATVPRPVGSPAEARARDFLTDRLRGNGFTVTEQDGVGTFARGSTAGFGHVHNVVGTLRGTAPTGTVLLMAHYDSVAGAPGAADDGSSVAALLELARILHTAPAPRNNVVLLLTDGEEPGLYGASRYARTHPAGPHDVVLNSDARGVSGPPLLFETSPDNAALVTEYLKTVPHPNGDSAMAAEYRLLPNDTDFTPLRAAGYHGMNTAFVGGVARYHTATDSVRFLDLGTVQAMGDNLLALTTKFASTDLASTVSSHDDTYFVALGFPVHYPNALALPVAVLACVAVLLVLLAGLYAWRLTLRQWLFAVLTLPLPVLAAGALGYGWWWAVSAIHPSYADVIGTQPYRPAWFWVAIALIGLLAIGTWFVLLRRRIGGLAPVSAGFTVAAAGAVLLAVYLPGAAFLLALPVIAAGFCTAIGTLWPRTRYLAAIGSAPATLLLAPAVYGLLQTAGLSAAPVAAGVAAFALVFWLPCVPSRIGVRPLPITALVLAVAATATGLALDRPDAGHPDRTSLAYLRNADTDRGYWVSHDHQPGPWTRQFVRGGSTNLFGELAWAAGAPAVPFAAPAVRPIRGGTGTRLVVSSPRGASHLELHFGTPVDTVTLLGPNPATVHLSGQHTTVLLDTVPPAGVELDVHRVRPGPLRLTAVDRTPGLGGLPGFTGYPQNTIRDQRPDSDTVLVTKNYVIS